MGCHLSKSSVWTYESVGPAGHRRSTAFTDPQGQPDTCQGQSDRPKSNIAFFLHHKFAADDVILAPDKLISHNKITPEKKLLPLLQQDKVTPEKTSPANGRMSDKILLKSKYKYEKIQTDDNLLSPYKDSSKSLLDKQDKLKEYYKTEYLQTDKQASPGKICEKLLSKKCDGSLDENGPDLMPNIPVHHHHKILIHDLNTKSVYHNVCEPRNDSSAIPRDCRAGQADCVDIYEPTQTVIVLEDDNDLVKDLSTWRLPSIEEEDSLQDLDMLEDLDEDISEDLQDEFPYKVLTQALLSDYKVLADSHCIQLQYNHLWYTWLLNV